MKKLFVWDFHGTLEKGNEHAVLELINVVLEKAGYDRRLTVAENAKLYGVKLWEYFAYLLPHESESVHRKLQNDFLADEKRCIKSINEHMAPNDHAHDVLVAIQKAGHDQIVISNAYEDTVSMFISFAGLSDFFPPGKYFSTNAHVSHNLTKHNLLEQYLYGKHFDIIVAIGDLPKNLEFAKERAAVTYLYAHPGREFKDFPATHKIHDLREVLKEI